MNTLSRRKVMVFIDHDLTVRHFIHSGAFRELEREFDVSYVFNVDNTAMKRQLNVDPFSLGLRRILITNIPRQRMGSWHRLYAITVLHNHRGTKNYRARRQMLTDVDGPLRTAFHCLLSLPGIYPLARRHYMAKQGIYKPLEDLLRDESPDLIIYPSILTGSYMNELLVLSKQQRIPFQILMNSWDNPSQKAVATGQPDKLAVWGEQTRSHAIEYLCLPPEKIEIFGAAQFQLYRQPVTESDESLRKIFNVPLKKRIVLYAGVSKSINETRHLQLLDDAIGRGELENIHIIYRPHPWRGGLVKNEKNFFEMGFRHVSMDPFMEPYYRDKVLAGENDLYIADYQVTRNLLSLVTGTISFLSTILLETLLHGKPVVPFLPSEDIQDEFGAINAVGSRLVHFDDLWDSPGVHTCRSYSELTDSVRALLNQSEDPDEATRIRLASHKFVDLTGLTYGERLVSSAKALVKSPPQHV